MRNLAYSATDDELHEAFCVHGSVTDAHVARDRESQKSKGFALVQYAKAQVRRTHFLPDRCRNVALVAEVQGLCARVVRQGAGVP